MCIRMCNMVTTKPLHHTLSNLPYIQEPSP